MRIQQIISQHRRDFRAILVCEHCENTQTLNNGYDDDNFHINVIPNIKCEKCEKVAPKEYVPLETKYEPWEVV